MVSPQILVQGFYVSDILQDVILILTCGAAVLAVVYIFLYFSIHYTTDDN